MLEGAARHRENEATDELVSLVCVALEACVLGKGIADGESRDGQRIESVAWQRRS
jgi:hypothetical protein